MPDHDDDEIDLLQKRIKVMELVLDKILLNERIIGLQRRPQMSSVIRN